MSYIIGNGATFRYLTENLPISGKRKRKLLLGIEKQESKKLKIFQKLLEYMNQSTQNRTIRAVQKEEMYLFTRKLTKDYISKYWCHI